jgi:hypothetical protein
MHPVTGGRFVRLYHVGAPSQLEPACVLKPASWPQHHFHSHLCKHLCKRGSSEVLPASCQNQSPVLRCNLSMGALWSPKSFIWQNADLWRHQPGIFTALLAASHPGALV